MSDDTWQAMWVTRGKPCVTMHGNGLCMWDTWQAMCVTHGMPCVNMHDTFEDYIRGFIAGLFVQARGEEAGGREKRKGGKERRKGGKEKKRKEEKRRRKRRKRGKRKRKRKEYRAVSKPRRQRTRNCTTRGRFPPTLFISPKGCVKAYGFYPVSG